MPDCIYDLRYDEIKPTALLSAPRCNSASLLGLVYFSARSATQKKSLVLLSSDLVFSSLGPQRTTTAQYLSTSFTYWTPPRAYIFKKEPALD